MRSTVIPWVVWLLLGLLAHTHLHALSSTGYTGYCAVRVYTDGGVMLEYRLSVDVAPAKTMGAHSGGEQRCNNRKQNGNQ